MRLALLALVGVAPPDYDNTWRPTFDELLKNADNPGQQRRLSHSSNARLAGKVALNNAHLTTPLKYVTRGHVG